MPTLSASWNASLPIRCVGTCPVNATIGIESMYASWSAVTRLVAAGPEVTMHTPDLPGHPRVPLGRVAGRRLLANEDVAQGPREVVERVVEGQDGAAGQPENHVHALTLERLQHDTRP